jgi:hypothetical protein
MKRPSDTGQDIYDTSVQLHAVVDEGMHIVDWVQRDPLVGVPSIFGPIALLTWAFRRARAENRHQDWTTR